MTTNFEFDPFDLSDVCDRLQAARDELARLDAAIEAAEDQAQALSTKRMEIERAGRDGSAVADALMADPTAVDGVAALLSPDIDAIRGEMEALRAARANLRQRRNEQASQVAALESDAYQVITLAAAPVIEALDAEISEHAEALISLYADVLALNIATRAGAYTVGRLGDLIRNMLGRSEPIVPARRLANVSPAMTAALTRLAKVAPGVPITALPSVQVSF